MAPDTGDSPGRQRDRRRVQLIGLPLGVPSPGCRADGGTRRLTVAQLELVARIEERECSLDRSGARVVLAGGRATVLSDFKAAVDSGGGCCGWPVAENTQLVSAAASLPERGAVVALDMLIPPPVARCLNVLWGVCSFR